jgi:hypothetical protein
MKVLANKIEINLPGTDVIVGALASNRIVDATLKLKKKVFLSK